MIPTIDPTFTSGLAVKITPFKAVFNDTVDVTHLQINATNDNLYNSCQLFWQVLDEAKVKHVSGVFNLTETDYTSFKADRMYAFTYTATKLGLTFI